MRSEAEIARILNPVLAAVERQSGVAERFVDKDVYRIYLATLWANLVMDPAAAGIDESDLENSHDVINRAAARVLGDEEAITGAYRFLNSKDGERAMQQAKLGARHRQLLQYFCSMILDPDGHRRWMEEVAAGRRGQRP